MANHGPAPRHLASIYYSYLDTRAELLPDLSVPKQRFPLALRETLLLRLQLGWPVQLKSTGLRRIFPIDALIISKFEPDYFLSAFFSLFQRSKYLRSCVCRRSMWVSWFPMSPCALGLIFKVRKISPPYLLLRRYGAHEISSLKKKYP